ncbi:cytidyltransferase [Yasminevirus sp. GU-2018]|uniref:Cytidyltransferase n=1 Tax=Yasminevirus sp. GU-2018 TaxID=2420051 RepID=A0A5K0U7D5_9VIRU|nr:cytidyltransferase [Yasminevirus sp. GU-2018]
MQTPERIICISGYFDPIHVGHLEYIKKSKALGTKLVVIVNNDHQAKLKKGRAFMPENERMEVIKAIKYVDEVVLSIDKDRTVCETLRQMTPTPHAFCNGGDQTNQSIPEAPICIEKGIDLIDGLGDKIQSSSWLTGLSAKK